jgi:hypothetical protein
MKYKRKELERFLHVIEKDLIPIQKKIKPPDICEVRRKIQFYKELEFN